MNPLDLILWALAVAGSVLVVGGAAAVIVAAIRGAANGASR